MNSVEAVFRRIPSGIRVEGFYQIHGQGKMMATMRIAQLQRAWRATSRLERLLCSTPAACGAHAAVELSQPWGKARSHYYDFLDLKFDWDNVLVG